jgi:hypothetical protein
VTRSVSRRSEAIGVSEFRSVGRSRRAAGSVYASTGKVGQLWGSWWGSWWQLVGQLVAAGWAVGGSVGGSVGSVGRAVGGGWLGSWQARKVGRARWGVPWRKAPLPPTTPDPTRHTTLTTPTTHTQSAEEYFCGSGDQTH